MTKDQTPRHYSVRTLLLVYGGMVTLPLLALLGLFFLRTSGLERHRVEQQLIQLTRDLANDFDRDCERRIATLRALAISPAIKARDWRGFHAQAKAALQDGSFLIVVGGDLRQLANTYVPYGKQPEFTGDKETALRLLSTKTPIVSDVFTSLVTKGPVYNVGIPVIEGGEVRIMLFLAVKADELMPVLKGQHLGEGWHNSIWDRKNVVVATTDGTRFAGTTLPDSIAKPPQERTVYRSRTIDGKAVAWRAVVSSKLSGWHISMVAPAEAVEGPLVRSTWFWAGAFAFTLMVTTVFAAVFANRLSLPIQRLAETARALDQGGLLPSPTRGSLTEANAVDAILRQSEKQLRERTEALRERERELARSRSEIDTLYETSPIGLGLIDRDMRFVRVNPALAAMNGVPIGDHAGKEVWEVMPSLRATAEPQFRRVLDHGDVVQTEFADETGGPPGTARHRREVFFPVRTGEGQVVGIGAVVIDTTENKELQRRRDLLMDELAHRGKNLLGVVQSIATSTFPQSQERASYLARLQSLSRTYASLNAGAFEGAGMAAIVANEVGAFSSRADISGPDLLLKDNPAQTMALVVHELSTNAVKYGAWSKPDGRVAIDWTIDLSGEEPRLVFSWRERGGPKVVPPAKRGFGSTITVKVVTIEFGAEPEESFAESGYRYNFSVPLAAVQLRSRLLHPQLRA